ncbi:hypothetical protein ABK040_014737 [Willaertia magna]
METSLEEKKRRWKEAKAKENLRKKIENKVDISSEITSFGQQKVSKHLIDLLTETVERSIKEELKIKEDLHEEKREADEDLDNFVNTEIDNHKCGICFELMIDDCEPMILVPCGHCFCASCINKLTRKNCPNCRAPIKSKTVNIPLKQIISSYIEMQQQMKHKLKQSQSTICDSSSSEMKEGLALYQEILNDAPVDRRPEVERYLILYSKAATRYGVLQKALEDQILETKEIEKHEIIAEQHLDRFKYMQEELIREIDDKMRELEEIKTVISKQDIVLSEIKIHKENIKEKVELIQATLDSVEKEKEKSKLIINNFVPNKKLP